MSLVALVPARGGSVRIPGKNIKPLAGHPLIAYTLAAAKQSGVFDQILVSSDSEEILAIADQTDGVLALPRPAKYATSDAPDVEWVKHALDSLADLGCLYDAFAILRPTSPFRTAATIQQAWIEFRTYGCDSLRAIEPVHETPYKMWMGSGPDMRPLLPMEYPQWHSRPTQTLPQVYKQNASLEIVKCSLMQDRLYPSITGPRVYGFLNPEPEGFDLNTLEDWDRAERMIASGQWTLPTL